MLVVFLWSVVLKYFVWSSHYVRIMLKVIVRNFLGDCIWLWTFDWWRRFQCDTWLSTAWPYIWKVLKFSLSLPAIGCCAFFCWRRFQFDHWLSTAWPYIWKVLRFSYCWRRFQCDTWLSTAWPYIWKVLKFSYFGLKTVISFYLDSHCWPMLSEYTIFFPILLNSVPVQFGYRLLVLRWLLRHIICR